MEMAILQLSAAPSSCLLGRRGKLHGSSADSKSRPRLGPARPEATGIFMALGARPSLKVSITRKPWGPSSGRSKLQRSPLSVRAEASSEQETGEKEKIPFGYTRKDVILVGVGLTAAGFGLKYGLQAAGLDPLQAGNVVQLVLVLGLMLAWLASYLFRVGGKEMTYVQQLKDYEEAVMKKRLEEMPEAEIESMLAAVEEEKRRLAERRKQ